MSTDDLYIPPVSASAAALVTAEATARAAAVTAEQAARVAADAAHAALVNNPHAVSKAQVGLGLADNTPDAGKPVSSAVATELAADRVRLDSVESSSAANATAITDEATTRGAAITADRARLTALETATQWAANPDSLISGVITRDANDAATSAPVVWPDGATGTYTATTLSTLFPGAVDAYTITKVGSPTLTFTQSLMTRNANGAITTRPAITVT